MQLKRFTQPDILIPVLITFLLGWSFLIRAGKGIESTWMMAFVAAACVFLSSLGKGRTKSVPAWAFWVGILFLFWSVLSWWQSTVNTYGFDELLRDSAGFLLFCTAAKYADDARVVRKFSILLVGLAIAACVVGAFVSVLQPVTRFTGVFFHILDVRDYWPNAWAEWLLLVWPISLFVLSKEKRVVRTVILGVLLATMVLSFSRGAVLVLIAQLILGGAFVGWQMFTSKKKVKASFYVLDGLFVLLTAVVVFSVLTIARGQFFPLESLAAKATLSASEGMQTVNERRDFWEQAWQLSWERPVIGFGPGTFRFVQPQLQHEVLATSDHPHNVFLKYAMERGWPAAILFLVFLILVLVPCVQAALRKDERAFLMSLSLVGLLAHNLIDYNLQFTLIAVPFWLMLGFACTQNPVPSTWFAKAAKRLRFLRPSKSVPLYQWTAQILLALVLLLLIVIEGRFMALERLANKVRLLENPDVAIDLYKQSHNALFPRDALLEEAQLLMDQNRLQEAQVVLQDFLRRSPMDARLWILLGDFSMQTLHFDDAHSAYARAYALSAWNDLRPLHGLLQVIGRAGSGKEFSELLPVAKDLLNEYAEAIRSNTHFIALSWHTEEFQKVVRLMAQMYPKQAPELVRLSNEVQLLSNTARAARARARSGFLW